MVEDIISGIAKLAADGHITFATLLLLVLVICLGLALWKVYSAKETQAEKHRAEMVKATSLMTTLAEQGRSFDARQTEIANVLVTAGQIAGKNQERLAKIETMLELGFKKQ